MILSFQVKFIAQWIPKEIQIWRRLQFWKELWNLWKPRNYSHRTVRVRKLLHSYALPLPICWSHKWKSKLQSLYGNQKGRILSDEKRPTTFSISTSYWEYRRIPKMNFLGIGTSEIKHFAKFHSNISNIIASTIYIAGVRHKFTRRASSRRSKQ